MTVADKSWKVGIADVVVIEADQSQKIENVLDKDLIFLAICTPRFELHNYRVCDET